MCMCFAEGQNEHGEWLAHSEDFIFAFQFICIFFLNEGLKVTPCILTNVCLYRSSGKDAYLEVGKGLSRLVMRSCVLLISCSNRALLSLLMLECILL